MRKSDFFGYGELLKNWVAFAQKHLYFCPEREGLICYGAGEHGHWGVHTHQKAFSAFAVLATAEEIDLSDFVITRQQLLEQALGMLRYNLQTHLEGDFVCTDGEKWGHNWIYALGIERMFHAIEAIEEFLTEEDQILLRKVMISESDFILNDYPIMAGLIDYNQPESNIWNGAILYRTAILYPDAPNRERYIEKARAFFANGISVEADENSDEVVDGCRIGDLFVGANMFDTYACNHHGYLNIGYMVICISNIAMLHFFLKAKGLKGDDIIYHHLREQWELVRATTFDDGRLLRIGGDSRARYCYCQDYALPSWALIEDVYGEDCSMLTGGWLKILQKETSVNGDGSFLSNRFGHFENLSPVYYTRLETDRANVISMVLYWNSRYELSGDKKPDKLESWKDDYHGAAFSATGNRYASFTWEASEKPQGLIVPQDDSSLAEWRYNLSARILGVGRVNYDEVEQKKTEMFDGGFLTSGTTICCSDDFLAEGQLKESMARKYIAFAALPDKKTVLVLQYAKTLNRTFVSEVAGIFWNVPNDIFNGKQRKLTFAGEARYFLGGDYANRYETVSLGNYVNVDEKIGLASKDSLTLVRKGERQVEIKGREHSGTLYAEEICAHYRKEYRWIDRNTQILDTGFAITLGDTDATKQLSDSLIAPEISGFRTVSVMAADGKRYVLAFNISERELVINVGEMLRMIGMGDTLGSVTDVSSEREVRLRSVKEKEAVLLIVNV